jgi:hypothetical protein
MIILPDPYLVNGVYDMSQKWARYHQFYLTSQPGSKAETCTPILTSIFWVVLPHLCYPHRRVAFVHPQATSDDTSEVYDILLLNALVIYVGVSSVAQAKAKSGSPIFNASDPGVVALHYLAKNLDLEGALNCTYSMTSPLTIR